MEYYGFRHWRLKDRLVYYVGRRAGFVTRSRTPSAPQHVYTPIASRTDCWARVCSRLPSWAMLLASRASRRLPLQGSRRSTEVLCARDALACCVALGRPALWDSRISVAWWSWPYCPRFARQGVYLSRARGALTLWCVSVRPLYNVGSHAGFVSRCPPPRPGTPTSRVRRVAPAGMVFSIAWRVGRSGTKASTALGRLALDRRLMYQGRAGRRVVLGRPAPMGVWRPQGVWRHDGV